MVKFEKRSKYYSALFNELCTLLEGSLDREKVAIAIMQEIAKDKRTEMMKQEREKQREKEGKEPATIKQIGFLKILGVAVDGKISKKKAAELIDRAKANGSREM